MRSVSSKLVVLPLLLLTALAALAGNIKQADASNTRGPAAIVQSVSTSAHSTPTPPYHRPTTTLPSIPAGASNGFCHTGVHGLDWWLQLICSAGPRPGLPTAPQPIPGGKGGDGCTENCDGNPPPADNPFAPLRRNGLLVCAPSPMHRIGEGDGIAMNLAVEEVSATGVYNSSEGPIQMRNATFDPVPGPNYGATCDPAEPGYQVSGILVDGSGNPDPTGAYYLQMKIAAGK